MKALSIKQPWAWLILHAGKDVENRTWPTKYRGPVLIHAGKTLDTGAMRTLAKFDEGWFRSVRETPRQCLLGMVTIVDCVCWHSSRWFEGPYGFLLRDPRLLPEPVPYRGALSFFDVPDELVPSEMISDMSLRGV